MKILISTSKGGLEDNVFPVLGRCPTFTIVNTSKKEGNVDILQNPGAKAGGGAGVSAAQAIIGAGADAVITSNCGPNALAVLLASGVNVYIGSGKVKDAVKELLEGKLEKLGSPNVFSHFGMGRRGGAGVGYRRR